MSDPAWQTTLTQRRDKEEFDTLARIADHLALNRDPKAALEVATTRIQAVRYGATKGWSPYVDAIEFHTRFDSGNGMNEEVLRYACKRLKDVRLIGDSRGSGGGRADGDNEWRANGQQRGGGRGSGDSGPAFGGAPAAGGGRGAGAPPRGH